MVNKAGFGSENYDDNSDINLNDSGNGDAALEASSNKIKDSKSGEEATKNSVKQNQSVLAESSTLAPLAASTPERTARGIYVTTRIERVGQLIELLIDNHGVKPELSKTEGWLIEQLDIMNSAHFKTQRGREHVNALDSRTNLINTAWSELSGDTAEAALSILRKFPERSIMVLGFRDRSLNSEQLAKQFDAVSALVLPHGDPHALHQFMQALVYLRNADASPLPADMRRKQLIIGDFQFYRPFLRGLFGRVRGGLDERTYYQNALETYLKRPRQPGHQAIETSVQLCDSGDDLDATIAQSVPRTTVAASIHSAASAETRTVSMLFIATGSKRKVGELRAGFGGDTTKIVALADVIGELDETPETGRTYVANAVGKATAFANLIITALNADPPSASQRALLDRLATSGVDVTRGEFHILAEDRGIEIPASDWPHYERYLPSNLIKSIRLEVEQAVGGQDWRIQPLPGVETKPWAKAAGSSLALYEQLFHASEAYVAETKMPFTPRFVRTSAMCLVNLDFTNRTYGVHNYSGATTYELRRPDSGPRERFQVADVASNGPPWTSTDQTLASEPTVQATSDPLIKATHAMRADGWKFEFENATEK